MGIIIGAGLDDDLRLPHNFSAVRKRRFHRPENFIGRAADEAELRHLLATRPDNVRMFFSHENFSGYDFTGLDLTGVAFTNCDLSKTNFTDANMKGMDLEGSTLSAAIITPQQLASARNVSASSLKQTQTMAASLLRYRRKTLHP